MISGALARRYARALLGLATSPTARDKFAKDLVALTDFARSTDEAAGRLQAEIVSAAPLPPDAVGGIKNALERATGKQIVMTTRVDPELIGGVVAKVGSYLLDGSLKSALARMRTALRG